MKVCHDCGKEIRLSHGYTDERTGAPLCDRCVIDLMDNRIKKCPVCKQRVMKKDWDFLQEHGECVQCDHSRTDNQESEVA